VADCSDNGYCGTKANRNAYEPTCSDSDF
jgi:hypothetical protein